MRTRTRTVFGAEKGVSMPIRTKEAKQRKKAARHARHRARVHLMMTASLTYCYIQLPDPHIQFSVYKDRVTCHKCLAAREREL